ncbi:unnamed protein product [Adineta steineri]|uniref:Uncharacterized protein n=1 Tax=Adineta steineri TaxID=433720 RepID=A0A815AYA8_9BILA|nr:unnamed protein product [Adineta steineri]CAF1243137.1 unnamed protein product [Adineta steineri]CAF1262863.1 unnamed protein product [Adineta steineri]
MPFYQLLYSEETKNWRGLLEYIRSNVPAYINAAYASVMKSIDVKLKEFVEGVVLEEGQMIQFCKVHDVEGTPSSYGKVYHAECRNDNIYLMATIKKGQKAAAGELTVEVLLVEQEILKIIEIVLEHLKIKGIYFPYNSLWNKLRNSYDIPRQRVGQVVQLVKNHVFVSKKHLLENDYDFETLMDKENIVAEYDLQDITTNSEPVSCNDQLPIEDVSMSSVMDSDDNVSQQSKAPLDPTTKTQDSDLVCQYTDQRKMQQQVDNQVKKQNRLVSELTMWPKFAPSNSKRCTSTIKYATTIGHKRSKKN